MGIYDKGDLALTFLMNAISYQLQDMHCSILYEQKWLKRPQSYRWSCVRHHLGLEKSQIVNDNIFKEIINDWNDFLTARSDEHDIELLKLHSSTGRPPGEKTFIDKLESLLEINLKKSRDQRKKKIIKYCVPVIFNKGMN